MGLLEALDRVIDRLDALDDRAEGVPKRLAESRPRTANWRRRPYFYWSPKEFRGYVLGLILAVGGLYRAIYDLSRSHYLAGFLWLGLGIGGMAIFLLSAMTPE